MHKRSIKNWYILQVKRKGRLGSAGFYFQEKIKVSEDYAHDKEDTLDLH